LLIFLFHLFVLNYSLVRLVSMIRDFAILETHNHPI
jgi:hypothetical protein